MTQGVLHTVPGRNRGGLEHRVVSQARWLQKRGIPVWIATPTGSATWEHARAAGIEVLGLNFSQLSVGGSALRLRKMLRECRASIVDCHGNKDAKAALFCRDFARIVRTVHVTPQARRGPIHRLKWALGCDRVIAVSHSIAEQLCRNGTFAPGRDAVIGEWAEPEFFNVPRLVAPATKLRLLLVGMLRPEKGIDLALAAMRCLRTQAVPAELSIAGEATGGQRAFAAALRTEVEARGLGSAVRFLGYRADVPALLAACDVVIVPSRAEAQSRIAAEAMAAGRPVVAFAVGGLPELVRPGETGWLVPPGDVAGLAECLGRLARTPAALIEAGGRCRAFARRHLNIDEAMAATLDVYGAAAHSSAVQAGAPHGPAGLSAAPM